MMMMRRTRTKAVFQRSGSATPPSDPLLPSQRPPTASSTSGNRIGPRSSARGEDEEEEEVVLTENPGNQSLN